MEDKDLLRAFVDGRDAGAFREVVDRYVHVVYAAARRQLRGNAHLAEDVTQAVFIMLSRKAGTIRDGSVLGGWLITTARLAARTALRAERRLKEREQRAVQMRDADTQNAVERPADAGRLEAAEAEAQLDEALARLDDVDRTAVTLRFLRGRSLREVGDALGMSEAAATKRVSRALDKLRQHYAARGLHLAPAVLLAVLAEQARVVAPAHLATAEASSRATTIASLALHHKAISAGAAKLLVAVICAAAAGVAIWSYVRHPAPASSSAPAVAATAATSRSGRIQVGVYFSHATAVSQRPNGNPRGYDTTIHIMSELQPWSADLDLHPVIEPGSETHPRLARLLEYYFPGKQPVDVHDAAALRTIDVVVCCSVCYPTDDALAALDAAVHDGTGLVVRQCLGNHNGGFGREVVRRLRGLDQAEPHSVMANPKSVARVSPNRHALFNAMSFAGGEEVQMHAVGAYAKLAPGAIPLLTSDADEPLQVIEGGPPVQMRPGYALHPLVVAQVGQGRVVDCSFMAARVPAALDAAAGGRFTVRCVTWAAGRAADEVSTPAQRVGGPP